MITQHGGNYSETKGLDRRLLRGRHAVSTAPLSNANSVGAHIRLGGDSDERLLRRLAEGGGGTRGLQAYALQAKAVERAELRIEFPIFNT
jgi:hypothetical protein